MDGATFVFGSFRLLPEQRLLLDGEKPLSLGSRALDILIALAERAGETIRSARSRSPSPSPKASARLMPTGSGLSGWLQVSEPEHVASALGAVFGITVPTGNPVSGLAAWLRDKRALVVLDNCEHVIDAVAAIAEALLRAAPLLCLLATSREPLRAEGEGLHRLASLAIPPDGASLTAGEALRYSAVQLFAERVTAIDDGFVLADGDVPAVLEICFSQQVRRNL